MVRGWSWGWVGDVRESEKRNQSTIIPHPSPTPPSHHIHHHRLLHHHLTTRTHATPAATTRSRFQKPHRDDGGSSRYRGSSGGAWRWCFRWEWCGDEDGGCGCGGDGVR